MKDTFLKSLFRLCFYSILLSTFVFGGFLQLFLGIPNTVITYISVFLALFFLLTYIVVKQKVILNKTVMFLLLFALLIIISGVVNSSGVLKTALYTLYFLLPLTIYLFFRINYNAQYVSHYFIKKLFFYIACVQLPIMILQKYAYPILTELNRSGQGIIEADIMFGSFFLKADHALGLFLLFTIFNIVVNNQNKEITKYPLLMFLYLGFTIMYSESNISKLLLLVFTAYSIYKIIPKKIKSIGLVLALLSLAVFVSKIDRIHAVKSELIFIEEEYNVKKSFRNYERGIAKRPQVVIAYATKMPLKMVGDGPYSYFDILTGKFTNTQHFSQIIWSYADLGIIGLILLGVILYNMVKSLYLPHNIFIFILLTIVVYSFMTTIFSDIAIMMTLCGLLQIRNRNQ